MIKDWRNENNLDSDLFYDSHLWNTYFQFMKNLKNACIQLVLWGKVNSLAASF